MCLILLLDGPLLTTRFLQISTSLFMVRLDNIFRYELNALLSQKPHLLCPSSFTAAGLTLPIFFFFFMLKNSIPSPFSQKMSYLSVLKTFSILQSATNTFSFLYIPGIQSISCSKTSFRILREFIQVLFIKLICFRLLAMAAT